jgi:hypothetical protein
MGDDLHDAVTAHISATLIAHLDGVSLTGAELAADDGFTHAVAADIHDRLDRAGFLLGELAYKVATGDIVRKAVVELSALVVHGHEDRWKAQGAAEERMRQIDDMRGKASGNA